MDETSTNSVSSSRMMLLWTSFLCISFSLAATLPEGVDDLDNKEDYDDEELCTFCGNARYKKDGKTPRAHFLEMDPAAQVKDFFQIRLHFCQL